MALPDILYHYCSLDSFTKIMENRSIWLSDVKKSNDKHELQYSESALLCALNELEKKNADKINNDYFSFEEFKRISHILKCDDNTTAWVLCLSEERDLLSQWRGYADNGCGIAIGFNRNYFEKIKTRKINQIYLGKMSYGLDGLFDYIDTQLCIDRISSIKNNQDFTAFYLTLLTELFQKNTYTKNKAFSEEKEWRLSITSRYQILKDEVFLKSQNNYFHIGRPGYIVKNNRLVSHIEIILNNMKEAVSEIILGPKCSITPIELKYYLSTIGLLSDESDESISISKSSASYQ